MSDLKFFIAHPGADISGIKSLLRAVRFDWLYLGDNFLSRKSIETRMGQDFSPVDIVSAYNDAVSGIKSDFMKWVDALSVRYGDDPEWWFGSVFSKNAYSSMLFQHVCYLEVLKRLFTSRGAGSTVVIFTESLGFAKAVGRWGRGAGMGVKIFYGSFFPSCVARRLRVPVDWMRFFVSLISAVIAARMTRNASFDAKNYPGKMVIIQTFIHDSSLSEEGKFNDSYFPTLYEYLDKKNIRSVINPVLYGFKYDFISIMVRMRKSATRFIIKEDFLRFSDYFYTLAYPVRYMMRRVKVEPFRGFDLSDIVGEGMSNELFSCGMHSTLLYRLVPRLKYSGLDLSLAILWHENQNIDKAFIAGLRKYYPDTKITGIQFFLYLPNYLSLYLSEQEVRAGFGPDMLINTSRYECDLAKSFTSDVRCRPGAALRHAYMFDDSRRVPLSARDRRAILVLLPSYLPESAEILSMVKKAVELIGGSIKVSVKPHPDDDPERMIKNLGSDLWSQDFKMVTRGLKELFAEHSLIISASSGALVEAAAHGIPVIYVGSQIMLNQNILKAAQMNIVEECYNETELKKAIERHIGMGEAEMAKYRAMGERVRETFFTPICEETMEPFLAGMDGGMR